MRRCPKCGLAQGEMKNARYVTFSDGNKKGPPSYTRRLICKSCGHTFHTYEIYMTAEEKHTLLKLVRLGREFIEFKAKWREAILKEYELRRQKRAEYQEERKRQRALREANKELPFDDEPTVDEMMESEFGADINSLDEYFKELEKGDNDNE